MWRWLESDRMPDAATATREIFEALAAGQPALETLDVLIITAGRSAGSDGAFIRKFGDGVESTVSPLRKTSGNTLGQALAHLEPHVSTRYLNRGVLF